MPLWTLGGLLFFVGMFGIGAVATNESETPRFSSADDGTALFASMGIVIASAVILCAAAAIAR